MVFISDFFQHLKAFTAAAQRRGATGEFRLGSMDAVINVSGAQTEFRAQYVVKRCDAPATYSMQFEECAVGFAGWLPYFNKRWSEAISKLAFKKRVTEAGLPTPPWSEQRVASELGDYVIKKVTGSFAEGLRGPFKGRSEASTALASGEFAESFIPGAIGKAWYWNDKVVALELSDPPFVIGDGVSTLGRLVKRQRRVADVEVETDFLRYRGTSWNVVPAAGEKVVVDYRYGSLCYPFTYGSLNRFEELKYSAVMARLNGWGPTFWSFVPADYRQQTLYSVDFMLDAQDELQLLEMNCNPTVPPEAYEAIFEALYGSATSEVSAPSRMVQVSTPHAFSEPPPVPDVTPPVPPMVAAPPAPTAVVTHTSLGKAGA